MANLENTYNFKTLKKLYQEAQAEGQGFIQGNDKDKEEGDLAEGHVPTPVNDTSEEEGDQAVGQGPPP